MAKPFDGSVPILRAGNIRDELDLESGLVHVDLRHVSQDQFLRENDIVICTSSGSASIVGKTAFLNRAWTGSVGAFNAIIRPNEKVSSRYLFHYLRSDRFRRWTQQSSGVNIKNIRKSELEGHGIPLPSMEEQNRIAAILDYADRLRSLREQAIGKLDELAQSLFLEMFGDPVTNPKGWERVDAVFVFAAKPTIGTIAPANGRGNRVVRVGQLGTRYVDVEACDRVELGESERRRYTLMKEDILIARAIGSSSHLGKASIFSPVAERVLFDSHVMRLRLDPEICDPYWFYAFISSDSGKDMLRRQGGATAVQYNINTKQVNSLRFPLPPLGMQLKFRRILNSIVAAHTKMDDETLRLRSLMRSLAHRAFRGELST